MVDPGTVAQYTVNGLVIGSILTLTAVGLTLVYGILNLANFAHGDLLTLGAYLALFFVALVGVGDATQWATWLTLALVAAVAFDRLARPRLVEALGVEQRYARHGMQAQEVAVALFLALFFAVVIASMRYPAPVPGEWGFAIVVGLPAAVAVARAATRVADGGDAARWLGAGALGALLAVALLRWGLPAALGLVITPWGYALAAAALLLAVGAVAAMGTASDPWVVGATAVAALLAAFIFGDRFLLSSTLALVIVAVISMALDVIIWRPMREQRASVLTLIIISIGLALALRNLIIVKWGPNLYNLPGPVQRAQPILGSTVTIAESELLVITMAAVVILLVHVLLRYTKMGKAMRALADNMDLARVTGIDVDRVILHMWAIAAALAALSGIMLGQVRSIHPNMGWFLLLPIFAAVILGGIGSPYGAMAGGLTIGLAMEVSPAFGVPVAYKLAVGFAVLILVLILRPQGIAGAGGEG